MTDRCRFVLSCLPMSVVLAASGCLPNSLLLTPVDSSRALTETIIYREAAFTSEKIAIIDVSGMLLNAHTPQFIGQGEHSVALLTEQLNKARRDPKVKGVVLRINSPGGTVTASEIMHDEIIRFRRETGKPVIASLQDLAASGGYYIACACDEIIAQRSTVTGSIGVIMQLIDFTGTMAKFGVASNAITSGPNKAAGSPFEKLSDDQRAIFQGLVDNFYSQFVAVVAEGRPSLDEEKVRAIADGRVYTASQALEHGLIDRLGTVRDAVDSAKSKTGCCKVVAVRYHRPTDYVANVHASSPRTPAAMNIVNIDMSKIYDLATPRFMYLWAP